MKMTVPVINDLQDEGMTIEFVIPKLHSDQTPSPSMSALEIKTYPSTLVAVSRFSGSTSFNKIEQERLALLQWVESKGYKTKGTVKIGDVPATEDVLDKILAADRDAIMLGIYRATFGETAEFGAFCNGCKDSKTVEINILEDIRVKVLVDPLEDRAFKVQGKNYEYLVKLPEGRVQRELSNNLEKTSSELDSVLLEYCVLEINGKQILSKNQVQSIGLADRRSILAKIIEKSPGPQFNDVKVTCPDCGGEVVVPINLGTLFQF
jgi:hypothetical protein